MIGSQPGFGFTETAGDVCSKRHYPQTILPDTGSAGITATAHHTPQCANMALLITSSHRILESCRLLSSCSSSQLSNVAMSTACERDHDSDDQKLNLARLVRRSHAAEVRLAAALTGKYRKHQSTATGSCWSPHEIPHSVSKLRLWGACTSHTHHRTLSPPSTHGCDREHMTAAVAH